MKDHEVRAAPRLRFFKEEMQVISMESPSEKIKRAIEKTIKPRSILKRAVLKKTEPSNPFSDHHADNANTMPDSFNEPIQKDATVQAEESISASHLNSSLKSTDTKSSKSRLHPGQKKPSSPLLHFDELSSHRSKKSDVGKEKKKPVKMTAEAIKPIARGLRDKAETQLSKYEDDNTGLQAAHTTEQAGSSVLHTGKQIQELRKTRLRHQEEKKSQGMSAHGLTFGEAKNSAEAAAFSGGSNPVSRQYQRKNIQKDYHAAKSSKKTGQAVSKTGKEAVEKAASVSDKAMEYVGRKKHLLAILLLGGMLAFIIQGLSACSPFLEAGIMALTMGTYPAEEVDIRAAEQYYTKLEKQLWDEMQRYELYHPGYDEYVVDAQEIWHDPYALIALISAYNNGEEWTLDDAIPIMQMFFDWQYEKSESLTSVQRYHTEIINGVETRVWHTVTICTVTLKNKNLSHAPVYTMSREKVGLYALYMSTHGNMDGLFHGPHISELKDPLEYDVPQELLDADPKFALLVEEANKRLGYPYVWGGYTPDTSFDCSGFISWIFTETGVRNIGHMGATGLYGISQHISEAELKPGDVIFFSGTIEGESGVTHCALYVGNGMMVHCGNPCSYYDIAHGSLRNNICGYGRLYQH